MSHYGISAVHWNVNLGEVDEVQFHEIVHDPKGTFAVSRGEPTWCSDVVSLIHRGNTIWVLVSVAPAGSYKNTDHIRIGVKQGGRQYLYSCTRDGTPTPAFSDLPRYQRADDLPPPELDRQPTV